MIKHSQIAKFRLFLISLVLGLVSTSLVGLPWPQSKDAREKYQDILGCWRGHPLGKFASRNEELRLISLRPDGRPAITLIYEIGPRSRVWDQDLEINYQAGLISWKAHRGYLSQDKKTIRVTKEWRGERSAWVFTRYPEGDDFMVQLKNSLRQEYIYQPPEELDDGWPCASLKEVGLDQEKITQFIKKIIQGKFKDIHSVLIIKDGQLVLEEYFATNGRRSGPFIQQHFRTKPHHLASTTKAVLSTLCGIALEKGCLPNVQEPIYKYLPDYDQLLKGKKKAITIEHLLTMTPGWAWEQFKYPWSDPRNNAAAMWAARDVIHYVLERPLAAEPGKKFKYSNGAPVVLGEVLHHACRLEVDKLAEKYLFKPLGISRYRWSRYFDGTLETDGGLALCSRDLAKIGQLFLNKGRWQAEKIISPQWIKESTRRRFDLGGLWKWGYGYYWMEVNLNYQGQTVRSFFVPGDGGQLLAVFPESKMVIVLTGGSYGTDVKTFCFGLIYQHILPAVHSLSSKLAFKK